jgi:hypothetical protein
MVRAKAIQYVRTLPSPARTAAEPGKVHAHTHVRSSHCDRGRVRRRLWVCRLGRRRVERERRGRVRVRTQRRRTGKRALGGRARARGVRTRRGDRDVERERGVPGLRAVLRVREALRVRRERRERRAARARRRERAGRERHLRLLLLRDRILHVRRGRALVRELGTARGQREVARALDAARAALAGRDVALGAVVEPEAEERERDARALDGVHRLREPDHREHDHRDALDERRDRVRDGRRAREEHERERRLREVHRAVRAERGREPERAAVVVAARRMCDVRVRGPEQRGKIRPEPDRHHEHKRGAGRVEEHVKLVQLVRRAALGRHDLLEEDVRGDEDDRRAEGTRDADGVPRGDVERAREHNTERQRHEREVRLRVVGYPEEQDVGGDRE